MEKIQLLIAALAAPGLSAARLQKALHSLILLLEDRNNYCGDKDRYPLSAFKEFVHSLLVRNIITSIPFSRDEKEASFLHYGLLRKKISKEGYFYIASPGRLFPTTEDSRRLPAERLSPFMDPRDVADRTKKEQSCQSVFNKFDQYYRADAGSDASLVRIILLLIYLFGDDVLPEVRAYFSYLVFSIPAIANEFTDDKYLLFPPDGALYRHSRLKGVLSETNC